jgi:hypothetical protein
MLTLTHTGKCQGVAGAQAMGPQLLGRCGLFTC